MFHINLEMEKKRVILYLIYNKECEINDSGETTTS